MSSSKKSAHVSILPLPKTRGMYKIQTIRGVIIATLSKEGKLDLAPSHMYDRVTKKWTQINENIGKALFGDTAILFSLGKTGISAASELVLQNPRIHE